MNAVVCERLRTKLHLRLGRNCPKTRLSDLTYEETGFDDFVPQVEFSWDLRDGRPPIKAKVSAEVFQDLIPVNGIDPESEVVGIMYERMIRAYTSAGA